MEDRKESSPRFSDTNREDVFGEASAFIFFGYHRKANPHDADSLRDPRGEGLHDPK